RADVSVVELCKLQQDHEQDPLPAGWFYDGAAFVDYDGNRRSDRPGDCFNLDVTVKKRVA
ncbi:unnamed protein product, partial [Sphacelaria rigidula]